MIAISVHYPRSLWEAADDLVTSMRTAYNANKTGIPTSFIVGVDSDDDTFCPKISQGASCTGQSVYTIPDINFYEVRSSAYQSDGDLADSQGGTEAIEGGAAITNLFQVMSAAIRLDIGNVLPNNLLVNSSAIDAVSRLNNGVLYSSLSAGGDSYFKLPLYQMDETFIDVLFECRFTYAKTWSEILISVFVATVSMFGSGWAIYMKVAKYLAIRKTPQSKFVHRPRKATRLTFLPANVGAHHNGQARKRGPRRRDSNDSGRDMEQGQSSDEKSIPDIDL